MAHAELINDIIQVTTHWNERELIKSVPGARWNTVDKVWYLPKSWAACIVLRGVFRDQLTIGDKLTDWAWAQRTRVNELMHMRTLLVPDWKQIGRASCRERV